MTTVIYMGRSYDDQTDWSAVLRDAAKYPFGPSWLRPDLDVASGLADLAEHLKGTSADRAIADAALDLVEHGTSIERSSVWQLPWERATNAIERLLGLLENDRQRFEELHGVPNVIWRLLQAHPEDMRVRSALQSEAAAEAPDPWILEMKSKYIR